MTRSDEHRSTPPPEIPFVSVIVPTYNRAHLLPRALRSVTHQTFSHFELIVVDDGSTDNTREVVEQVGDPRVRYIRLPANQGVAAARNRGMRAARGELIAFLDSDDEWMPQKLSSQVALFRRSSDRIGLTYTGVETVDHRGGRRVDTPRHRGDIQDDILLRNVLHGGGSSVMIRRSAMEAAGEFDEDFVAIEDYEYWVRVASRFHVDFVAEPLLRYHDPIGREDRKSLNIQENLAARECFYQKYRTRMRHASVAHLFLMESARRHKAPPACDRPGARRLALRAALQKPLWWEPYRFLLGTLPEPLLRLLRTGRRMLFRK